MSAQDNVEKPYAAWQESITEYHKQTDIPLVNQNHVITKAEVDAMAPIDKETPIIVMQEADGVTFVVNGTHFRVDQEETNEKLVEMFKFLGFTDVSFEECY